MTPHDPVKVLLNLAHPLAIGEESGRADGQGGLSPRTVRYVFTILRSALAASQVRVGLGFVLVVEQEAGVPRRVQWRLGTDAATVVAAVLRR